MESVVISKKLLKRLPMYLAHLKSLPEESNVSGTSMARALGLGEVMVRKDLAKISETGRRRTGRSRERLIRDIEEYLYLAAETPTVIVGAGKLGRALLDYSGVSAIWNFAPVHLQVPDHVVVQSENLAISLTALRIQMRKQKTA